MACAGVGASMSTVFLPLQAIKGRGAASRIAHRFETEARQAFDDGWSSSAWGPAGPPGADPPLPQTEVRFEDAGSALTSNDSPNIHFEHGLNPYRGCEHGCVYCYARPTHSYLGLSPGLDFETRIIAKRNIAAVLARELARAAYRPSPIVIGTVTDAYQPVERELRITRGVLELLARCRHPFSIITKSAGVERDLDLLAPMAAAGLVSVHVTVTTLDPELARKLEPRAAAPWRRLRTIETLAAHGIPVGVSVAPQIPFVNQDMEQVLQAAANAGACSAFYTVLRLPWELSPLFRQWLQLHYPLRAQRIMARVQDLHAIPEAQRAGARCAGGAEQPVAGSTGRDYNSNFASRMKGSGVWAELTRQRFEGSCRRLGLNHQRHALDSTQFRPGLLHGQDSLF